LIKHANILVVTGQVDESLVMFERAAEALDPAKEPELWPVIIAGRVNALCDLERFEEAGSLLKSAAGVFPKKGDAHATALYWLHRARVSAGLGDLAAAEAGFLRSRDQFLALGREYDAISTSLYLADTLFAAGKIKELRRLAAELVPLFRSCGVELETLAALRLLTEATRSETLTGATLGRLRRRLMGPRPVAATASEADLI
jgi:tetratricopeptide (TPR) repeat protein